MPVCRCQTPRIEIPRLFRVILPVSDIEVAASFYAHLLENAGTRVSTGRHYFDCAGTILACYDALTDGDPERVGPNPQHVYFSVDDLDAAHARAEHAECRELTSIEIRPWGERSFYARDPFAATGPMRKPGPIHWLRLPSRAAPAPEAVISQTLPHPRMLSRVPGTNVVPREFRSRSASSQTSCPRLSSPAATNQNSGGRLVAVENSSVSSADHLGRDRWSGPGAETNRRESVLPAGVVLRPSGYEAPSDGRPVITDLSL